MSRFAVPVVSRGGAAAAPARSNARPQISQPVEIGCYARGHTDAAGVAQLLTGPNAKSRLRRLREVSPPVDLDQGRERFTAKRYDTTGESLDPVLQCLPSLDHMNVVSFRNNFNKLMATPYAPNDAYEIDIHRLYGRLYFGVRHLDLDKQPTDAEDRFTYWGYHWETLATEPIETVPTEHDHIIVDANVEFCSVVYVKIGGIRIALGAEIDAYVDGELLERLMPASASARSEPPSQVGSKRPRNGSDTDTTTTTTTSSRRPSSSVPNVSLNNYVEIKTTRVIDSERGLNSFRRHKLLRWWIQSFLVGVPMIYVGERDDRGMVLNTKAYRTRDLPAMAAEAWDPFVCLSFVVDVLAWLLASTSDNQQYRLRHRGGGGGGAMQRFVELEHLRDAEEASSFLPQRFVHHEHRRHQQQPSRPMPTPLEQHQSSSLPPAKMARVSSESVGAADHDARSTISTD